ncbi:MAG: hypothetical protein OXC00_09630 [Acidimicrobiaceae bacterium]|nr:hypothetical protein [Acidimicrobiaceae bacterium]
MVTVAEKLTKIEANTRRRQATLDRVTTQLLGVCRRLENIDRRLDAITDHDSTQPLDDG